MEGKTVARAMERHAEEFGLQLSTIGQWAVKNRNVYDRLKAERSSIGTARRVLEWIEKDAKERRAKRKLSEK